MFTHTRLHEMFIRHTRAYTPARKYLVGKKGGKTSV